MFIEYPLLGFDDNIIRPYRQKSTAWDLAAIDATMLLFVHWKSSREGANVKELMHNLQHYSLLLNLPLVLF